MPNLNAMFPSKYLKADDLKSTTGKGFREFSLTITGIKPEVLTSKNDDGSEKKENKWVMYFKGAEKGMVVNKTNAQAISDYYGDDTDHWTGKKIILFVATVATPQGPKPGIRVRVPSEETFDPDTVPTTADPMAAAAAATLGGDDGPPF